MGKGIEQIKEDIRKMQAAKRFFKSISTRHLTDVSEWFWKKHASVLDVLMPTSKLLVQKLLDAIHERDVHHVVEHRDKLITRMSMWMTKKKNTETVPTTMSGGRAHTSSANARGGINDRLW